LIRRPGTRDLVSMNSDLDTASATRFSSPMIWRTWRSMECCRRMSMEEDDIVCVIGSKGVVDVDCVGVVGVDSEFGGDGGESC
jgi:hypothetical protein